MFVHNCKYDFILHSNCIQWTLPKALTHFIRFALHTSVERVQRLVYAGEFLQKRRRTFSENMLAWFASGAQLFGAQILVVRVLRHLVVRRRWPECAEG